jgi:hypothetical protein
MRARSALSIPGVLAGIAAALAALPASAQRPADPLSIRDPLPRPYERAYAWRAYAPAANAGEIDAGRPAWLLGSGSGVGFNLSRTGALDPGLRAPPALASTAGMEPIPSATYTYIGYRIDRWTLLSSVRQGLDASQGTDSARVDFGASYGFNLTPRHLITLAGAMTLGHSRTPALPLGRYTSSELTAQSFRAGEPGMGLRLSWTYTLDDHLFVDTSFGYDRLQGGAESLQGVERGSASFGTTFGLRW